jgi:hypothetical protein
MTVTLSVMDRVELYDCVELPAVMEPVNATEAEIGKVPVLLPATTKESPDLSKTDWS